MIISSLSLQCDGCVIMLCGKRKTASVTWSRADWRLSRWRHRKSRRRWRLRQQRRHGRSECQQWLRLWVADNQRQCGLYAKRVHRPSTGCRCRRRRGRLLQWLLPMLLDAATDDIAVIRTEFRWRRHWTTYAVDRLQRPTTLTSNSSFKVVLTPTQLLDGVAAAKFHSMMSTENSYESIKLISPLSKIVLLHWYSRLVYDHAVLLLDIQLVTESIPHCNQFTVLIIRWNYTGLNNDDENLSWQHSYISILLRWPINQSTRSDLSIFFVCYQSSSVGLCIWNYKSSCIAVMIFATLTNRHTSCFWVFTG